MIQHLLSKILLSSMFVNSPQDSVQNVHSRVISNSPTRSNPSARRMNQYTATGPPHEWITTQLRHSQAWAKPVQFVRLYCTGMKVSHKQNMNKGSQSHKYNHGLLSEVEVKWFLWRTVEKPRGYSKGSGALIRLWYFAYFLCIATLCLWRSITCDLHIVV